jgi:hypothetical protein
MIMESFSVKDIFEAAEKERKMVHTEKGLNGVSFQKGFLQLDGWYEIDIERVNTKERLLSWICHLLDKKWVTPHHLRWLVELSSEKHGFSPYEDI